MFRFRHYLEILAPHIRAGRRLVGILGISVCGYATGISVYSQNRWKSGNTRLYDSPKWNGYNAQEITEILERRRSIICTLRDLYEMKEGLAKDGGISSLFDEKCTLEDPNNMIVGPGEIMSAFAALSKKNKFIHFTVFKPTHYPNMIVINCQREFEFTDEMYFGQQERLINLKSNLVVHLESGENKEEKMKYIVDEWNYVSLLQPETHNAFFYAGSVAKWLRRLSSKINLYYFDEDKFINPFIIIGIKDKVTDYVRRKWEGTSDTEESQPENTEMENVFNAGTLRSEFALQNDGNRQKGAP